MNFWEFIVELIHYGAWPAIVAVLLYVFRKHISDLLKSQIRVRHKETEVELNVPLAQERIQEIEMRSPSKTTDIGYEMYINRVEILAVYTAAISTGNRNFLRALQTRAKKTFKNALETLEKEKPDCKSLDFLHEMKAQIESSGKDERKPRWNDNL